MRARRDERTAGALHITTTRSYAAYAKSRLI
jgi:hypothetical protein